MRVDERGKSWSLLSIKLKSSLFNPFRAPEPLPILNPSKFVPQYGFPVVKGLRKRG